MKCDKTSVEKSEQGRNEEKKNKTKQKEKTKTTEEPRETHQKLTVSYFNWASKHFSLMQGHFEPFITKDFKS